MVEENISQEFRLKVIDDSKNSKFIKEREASIVLSSLGTKTLLGKILY